MTGENQAWASLVPQELSVPEVGVHFWRSDEADGTRVRVLFRDGEVRAIVRVRPVEVVGLRVWEVAVGWKNHGRDSRHVFPLVKDEELAVSLADAVGIGAQAIEPAQAIA